MPSELARGRTPHADYRENERNERNELVDPPVRDPRFPNGNSVRMLRLPQVMQQTGLKKTKLYELQAKGIFPMRIQITSNSVGWIEEDIQRWIAGRIAASKPLRTK